MPLAHGVVPWALSWLAPRYGWTAGYPGTWNWLGLIPIAAGTAVLIWIFASGLAHVRELPERVQILPPSILITYGPYAYTRNPLYVAEMALWLGWAILFGSLVVLLVIVVLTVCDHLGRAVGRARARETIRRDLSPVPGQGPPMAGEDSTLN